MANEIKSTSFSLEEELKLFEILKPYTDKASFRDLDKDELLRAFKQLFDKNAAERVEDVRRATGISNPELLLRLKKLREYKALIDQGQSIEQAIQGVGDNPKLKTGMASELADAIKLVTAVLVILGNPQEGIISEAFRTDTAESLSLSHLRMAAAVQLMHSGESPCLDLRVLERLYLASDALAKTEAIRGRPVSQQKEELVKNIRDYFLEADEKIATTESSRFCKSIRYVFGLDPETKVSHLAKLRNK